MPIPSSDLVTVPREVLSVIDDAEALAVAVIEFNEGKREKPLGTPLYARILQVRSTLTQSDVWRTTNEDVQGSIATKQPADLTSAPATETTLENYIRTGQPLFSTAWEREEYERLIGFTKSDGGVEGHARRSETPDNIRGAAKSRRLETSDAKGIAGIKPGPSDPLTKTPSADHDAGNLRSLAEPSSPRLTDGDQTGGVG